MKQEKHSPLVTSTRRGFLKTSGAIAAGLALSNRSQAQGSQEQLALFGGPRAVTWSTEQHEEAYRWPLYGPEEEKAVVELLKKPDYEPIDRLEEEWQAYTGSPHVKAHCNGTSALASMFFALDLPPGSEIMVPSYTFFATIVPMRMFGLVPVFVDINPRTLNFDLDDAKKRLTRKTKAVLPVHWIGLPCDMDAICDWANKEGLIVLEDAAHAHGARLQGKLMGNWSRMSIFSYQGTKPLPAIEGGMGMYEQQEDYDRATTFGHYKVPGVSEENGYAKYVGTGLGLKFRMHPIAAELARCQLRRLDERNAQIAAQARRLDNHLVQLPGIYQQPERPDMERIYYNWNMLFINEAEAGMTRAACVKALKAEGIKTSELQYRLQHKCAIYKEKGWWHHKPTIPELPGSEEANATALPLPLFSSDVPELVEQYIKAFEKVWAHRKELATA